MTQKKRKILGGVLAALVLNSRNPSQAMVVALAYGVGLHLKGHGWMFDSLMGPVHAGWLMSVLGTSLFVLYLALFTAIPAAVSASGMFRCCTMS